MLKKRILTATLLITFFVFAILYLPLVYFAAITGLVCLLAAFEWTRLAGFEILRERVICFVGMVVFVLCLFLSLYKNWIPRDFNVFFAYGIFVFWLAALFMVYLYPKLSNFLRLRFVGFITGILLILPAWISLLILYTHNPFYILYLFVLIWAADIAAFFSGRRFGQHKLAPEVSPGKTWEGVFGALFMTLIIAGLGFMFFKPSYNIALWMILNILTVSFSIVGDLFESVFKRLRNMKDSGSILPGHGGILDRIDSLTAALPLFLLGMELARKFG